MFSSSFFRSAAFVAFTASVANAASFLKINDNAEVFLTGTAKISADDNIYFSNSNKKSSGIFDFQPGVELNFGQASLYKGIVYFNEDFRRYFSASDQNANLATVGLQSKYDDDKSSFILNGGFAQVAQNSRDTLNTASIVRRDVTSFDPSGDITVSPKFRLGAGFDYANIDYKPVAYTDSSTYAVPLDAYYEVTPKLFSSIGYRYRDTQLSGTGIDSSDHFFNIGAKGDFSPKLTGTIKVGYIQHKPDVGSSQGSLGLLGSLDYEVSPKTTLHLLGSNDFANAATGESQKVLSFTGGITSVVSDVLVLDLAMTYGGYKYQTTARKDDYFEGTAGLTYKLNQIVSFGGAYTYRNNSSSLSGVDFTNNVFSLSASVRY